MSIRAISANIGRIAEWRPPAASELAIMVEITDARPRFGSVDYHIRPVSGSGVRWVSADSVRFASDVSVP